MSDHLLEHLGPESKGAGSTPGPTIALNNILAPVDFSGASRSGLAFAADVATRFHARLHLLYVVEPPSLPEWGYVHLAIKEAELRRTAQQRLPELPSEAGISPSLVQSATVRSGFADSEICAAAMEQRSDLIVIASHGLGGLKHALIGSTAANVVRRAPCPVLTVRAHALAASETARPTFAPRRVLVPTDFSEASKSAFPYAIALAHKFEASLLLAYVVSSHWPAEIVHIGIVMEEQSMLAEARKRLPRFREAELDPRVQVETLVLHGQAAHEICATAKAQDADLIVMATHGHTGFRRFTVGSVTENVVRHACCPVLVVREHEHEFLKA